MTHVTPSRWLVTGAGGMLGRDLASVLADADVNALSRSELDICDPTAVAAAVPGHDVVVNAAAWTDVDAAEEHEADATRINGLGPQLLAAACAAAGARLVHVSTDYVFDGTGREPYAEDCPLAPRSAYGRSKAAGETAVRSLLPDASYVVRTAWLYGEHGPNFVNTMANLEASRDVLDVVDDQVGAPTWSLEVARAIRRLVEADAPAGTYHATAAGQTSWFGLAQAVFEELGADPARVRPTTTDMFPRPAPRPAYSVLGHAAWTRAGLTPLGDWRRMLAAAAPTVIGPR
ncbi:MAG: dTDP-4-dehydrorhamnose reductase [Actinomycetes bacterium]